MGYYKNLLVETAVLKTVDGTDNNGRPNIIALDEIDCKIEFKNTVVKNKAGEEQVAAGRLFTEATLKTNDIVEIKDKEFHIISVQPYYPVGSSIFVINEASFA